ESAYNTAREMFGNDASISDQGLWIFPQGSRGKAVRRLLIETDLSRGGSWLVYLDATNPRIALISKRAALTFEGEGNIWLENPVTTPSRQSQVFRNMDATKSLSGKFVKVLNANSKHDASLPLKLSDYTTAKEGDRKYNYEENDLRLAEAMAYFHINRVHDQWSLFGFHGLDARAPVIVNLAVSDGGAGWDNAQYQRSARFPRTGLYTFGSGNQYENTGLDADIYYHEYAHGVLDKINSKLLDSVESIYPAAFHEAFADISAAAITGNSKFAEFGFRLKQSKQFRGRNMNNRKKFPQDVVWPEAQLSEPHYTCLIADGTWWDLQKLIGRYQAQRLLYDSARMLSTKMNFFDVKDAMLAADRTLNNGANSAAIERSFQLHGLGGTNPGQKGTFSVQRLLTAALPPGSNYVVQSTFSKGEMVTLILEYNASNLLPGYWLVPSKLEVNGPSGATPRTQFLIAEVFNGEHQGTKGVYFAEIYTDSSSPSGTYTVKFQPRLGGTDRIFTEQSVTFTLN
ncbi:MAG TPA: M36 family metallopeptidase, partial [Acidobacteriota bacterium]|nr:M36 family metallopeptidase [Acidobacteriota bacterium]